MDYKFKLAFTRKIEQAVGPKNISLDTLTRIEDIVQDIWDMAVEIEMPGIKKMAYEEGFTAGNKNSIRM